VLPDKSIKPLIAESPGIIVPVNLPIYLTVQWERWKQFAREWHNLANEKLRHYLDLFESKQEQNLGKT
jgi:hypothetical protein